MNKEQLKAKLANVVEFELEVLPEYDSPEGYFASGDDEQDKETVSQILSDLENGNEYAWFTARVVAKYNGFEADDYLGACSYANETEFKTGGYFDDMKSQALDSLVDQIIKTKEKLNEIEAI